MALTSSDPVRHPAHYEIYPVQPIEITRHLGFCLGNAVKYVLRAPWKGGVEDCDKALQYLAWERETPQGQLSPEGYDKVYHAIGRLKEFLDDTPGDTLWNDVSVSQWDFFDHFELYLSYIGAVEGEAFREAMVETVRNLSRILALRDTTGQIYECMTGRPQTREAE